MQDVAHLWPLSESEAKGSTNNNGVSRKTFGFNLMASHSAGSAVKEFGSSIAQLEINISYLK
jgi:hypothetical protein